MRKLAIALGATLTLALVLLAIGASVARQFAAPDPVELERQQLAIERARALAPVETFAAVAWTVLPIAAALVALALAALWGVAAVARFRHERKPNARGLLPVNAYRLDDVAPAALAAFHATQLADAQRALVPASLNYSPHYSPRLDNRSDGSGVALLPAGEQPAAISAPSFGDLLSAGKVGRGQPLLLGIDAETGEEIPGAWLDLYATATAGLPGSGKTTSQRFFASQTALHGARFVVCDPHASAGSDSLAGTLAPLRSVYLCEPAEEPKAILEAVKFVADIGEARKSGRDKSTTPIILWVDELTGLLGRSDVGDALAELLEQIAQEYRKKWVYLSASGQIWTASRTTSELRDSLASVLCHRMKRSQARLLLPTDEAAQVERLATGEAILWRTSGATTRVRIPNTTAADVAKVAELLGQGDAAPQATARPMGFHAPALTAPAAQSRPGPGPESGPAQATASESAKTLDAETARILARFTAGATVHELAAELAGTTNPGDRRYKAAREKVEAMLRKLAEGAALA